MCPSLVKIQYTELKLSCVNDPVVRNSIYSNGDLRSRSPLLLIEFLTTGSFPHDNFRSVYWILTKLGHMIPSWKGGLFPFYRGIMWPSMVKIQYTELKLSCGNDPVVKNSIHSNGDLDL
jgi:hypothetical protein